MEPIKIFVSLILSIVLTLGMITSIKVFVPKIMGWEENEDASSVIEVPEDVITTESPEEKSFKEAMALFENGDYTDAMAIFETLGEYNSSHLYYADCLIYIEAEKIAAEKESKYTAAILLMQEEKYKEAFDIFAELGDYKQSPTQIAQIIDIFETRAFNLANEGDYQGACTFLAEIGYNKNNNEQYQAYDYAANGDFANAVLCGLSVVVFPEGTESIPDNYFKDKDYTNNLQVVILPPSVKTIGKFAFAGCVNLTEIKLSEELVSIGESAFERCMSLESIELPVKLIEIGESAFASSGIAEINFPDTLQFIYDYAFAGCNAITSVTLPNGLLTLGESAFLNCEGLLSVIIGDGLETISENAFRNCMSLTSVSISEGTKNIGGFAFADCINLASVTFPQSLEGINDNAFYQCKKLKEITITTNINWIGKNVFVGCTSLKKVYFENTENWTDGVRVLKVLDASSNASKLVTMTNTPWYKKQV